MSSPDSPVARTSYMSLTGATVVIIGGSSGIGLAVARLAKRAGASVVIAARRRDRLAAAARRLGTQARAFQVDIANQGALQQLFEKVGHLHHLVITAADVASGMIQDIDPDTLRPFVEARLWGPIFAVKYALPELDKSGSITLISGVGARKPKRGAGLSLAIAGAMEPLGRVLAAELAPIRVNVVCPGTVGTHRTVLSRGGPAEARAYLAARAAELPLGRIGHAGDVAQAVMFFITNNYATGATLTVDGGDSLY